MVGSGKLRSRSTEPPRDSTRGGSMRSEPDGGNPARRPGAIDRREWNVIIVIAATAIATRLLTTIYYVEDPDSLHFALSMVDFDIARLQPHFPGYLVFVGLARLFTAITGSFAVGFSLVGALATVLLLLGVRALAGIRLASRSGLILAVATLGNGMLWVYANRYMPDLLGTALLVWTLHDLTSEREGRRIRGAFTAALLAGTRLSYIPFLLPVALYALTWRGARLRAATLFVAGILLWAVPLLITTGWPEILTIAANQTTGHFDEFGGTIRTEPNIVLRLARMLEGIWSDALTGYWRGRDPLTVVAGLGALVAIGAALSPARTALRSRRWQLIAAAIASYLVWIFLYQNVIYHSRHLLPLVPFLLLGVTVGLERILRRGMLGTAVVLVTLGAATVVGVGLAWQHKRPSAIAQAGEELRRSGRPLTVVSTRLVNDYLAATGVQARFLAVDSEGIDDSLRLRPAAGRVVSVGDYRDSIPFPAAGVRRFYHNPYVNRIWPQIELYDYAVGGSR